MVTSPSAWSGALAVEGESDDHGFCGEFTARRLNDGSACRRQVCQPRGAKRGSSRRSVSAQLTHKGQSVASSGDVWRGAAQWRGVHPGLRLDVDVEFPEVLRGSERRPEEVVVQIAHEAPQSGPARARLLWRVEVTAWIQQGRRDAGSQQPPPHLSQQAGGAPGQRVEQVNVSRRQSSQVEAAVERRPESDLSWVAQPTSNVSRVQRRCVGADDDDAPIAHTKGPTQRRHDSLVKVFAMLTQGVDLEVALTKAVDGLTQQSWHAAVDGQDDVNVVFGRLRGPSRCLERF